MKSSTKRKIVIALAYITVFLIIVVVAIAITELIPFTNHTRYLDFKEEHFEIAPDQKIEIRKVISLQPFHADLEIISSNENVIIIEKDYIVAVGEGAATLTAFSGDFEAQAEFVVKIGAGRQILSEPDFKPLAIITFLGESYAFR